MNTVRANAYAKLNLTLDITGRGGGYHMLDSLAVTVDVFDRIVITKRRDDRVRVSMRGGGSETIEDNNAERAALAFQAAFHTAGMDVTVYKNIPIGAGMGGSSADAAGVCMCLAKLFGVSDMAAVKRLADTLGSDTGYLLFGGLARLRGRGERVSPMPAPPMHFVIYAPEASVSTAACYRAFDEGGFPMGSRTEEAARLLSCGNLPMAAMMFGNDLYPAAKTLSSAVEEAYFAARECSPLGAGMTGSGSAAFALFETRELADWAKSRYRGRLRAIRAESVDPKARRGRSLYSIEEGD